MKNRIIGGACAVLLASLAACQTSKSSNPTAPTVAGPIAGVNISAPTLVQPAQGQKFKADQQPIQLVVNDATTNGVRPLTYTFEVAADSGFATKVFSRAGVPQGTNQTSVQLDPLEIGKTYYWRSWAEDGANTGSPASSQFDIFPQAAVNPPAPIAPLGNAVTSTNSPVVTAANSTIVGPVGGLSYEFQVASDQAFTHLVAAIITGEGSGQTSFTAGSLPASATMFWRVRASDGQTTSAWSATQVFRTPAVVAPPPPASGAGGGTGGGTCTGHDALSIISCERNKFGHMTASDEVQFLKNAASSLNRNGIQFAPFGILRKSSGSSCNGYSCDIICSGNGSSSQRQWDVLSDGDPWPNGGAQNPTWNGPSMSPNIRLDVCEIQ
jgi:hypothetical protein